MNESPTLNAPANQQPAIFQDKQFLFFILRSFLAIIILGVGIIYLWQLNKTSSPKNVTNNQPTTDTIHYKNNILGLEFDYPKEWGEIEMYPVEAVTNLASINKEHQNSIDEKFVYRLELSFNQKGRIEIQLINDQFVGEPYPNSGASDYEPMDNSSEIKTSQDVCQYKINYNHSVYHAKSIYSDCQRGINEVLVKKWYSDYEFVNYELRRLGYKRLQNGYFDNFWLISVPNTLQSNNLDKDLTVEEMVSELDKDQDLKDKEDIVKLIKSVKSFIPEVPTTPVFKNISGEDENITLIRKYYFYLATHNFEEAQKISTNISLENIRDWYQNVYHAEPINFQSLGQGSYRFEVDYQDENMLPVKYLIDMTVINGKLKTTKSEKYLTPIIYFGNMSAVVKERQDQNYVVLTKDNKEFVLDQADTNYNKDFSNSIKVAQFSKLEFSPTGKYLIYQGNNFGGYFNKIADTVALKPINLELPAAIMVMFNSDDTKLLTCGQSDVDGTLYADIYSLDGLVKIKDFIKDMKTDLLQPYYIFCNFNKTNQVVTVEFEPWNDLLPKFSLLSDLN